MPRKAETKRVHRRAIERVIGSMRSNFDLDYRLADMADTACMSPFHFIRVFRSLTGVPPSRYLSALRLQEAKRLLLETELSVTDVCFEVGYSSLGTFIRRFSEVCGVSPGQLRSEAHDPQPDDDILPVPTDAAVAGPVDGSVVAPSGFRGVIFVGAFEGCIPQGRPSGCAILGGSGPFRLRHLADGDYHLLAAGVPRSGLLREWFLCDKVLRATGGCVTASESRVVDPPTLSLREALPTDPPILLSFPALLAGGGREAPTIWRKRHADS